MEADPVGVQKRGLSHFKGLFKTFKMMYSMSLYSDRIVFKFRFQKSHFTHKNGNRSVTFARLCTCHLETTESLSLQATYMIGNAACPNGNGYGIISRSNRSAECVDDRGRLFYLCHKTARRRRRHLAPRALRRLATVLRVSAA